MTLTPPLKPSPQPARATYSRLRTGLLSLTPGDSKCILYCRGASCKYCIPHGTAEDRQAIAGLYSTWITEDLLAMGRLSHAHFEDYDIIEQFRKAEIRSVVNLEEHGEHSSCGRGVGTSGFSYDPVVLMDNNIFYYNFPLPDFGSCSSSRLLDICKVAAHALSIGVYAEDSVDGEVNDEVPVSKGDDDETVGPSRDAAVSFLFTQPSDANSLKELHSGKIVKFLIGFHSKGEKDSIVKHSDTSFRYPMDFNYYIQNFTVGQYNRLVAPKEQVTPAFFARESFAGRPLGLVVNLAYEDSEGRFFINNVFNQTVTIIEDDSGFNGETGFLFLLFAVIAVLLLAGQHFLNKLSRKAGKSKKRTVVEKGTSNDGKVDYEWIPRDILKMDEVVY